MLGQGLCDRLLSRGRLYGSTYSTPQADRDSLAISLSGASIRAAPAWVGRQGRSEPLGVEHRRLFLALMRSPRACWWELICVLFNDTLEAVTSKTKLDEMFQRADAFKATGTDHD